MIGKLLQLNNFKMKANYLKFSEKGLHLIFINS